MKKLIGVTCFFNNGRKGTTEKPYYRLNRDYCEAIEDSGGLPVILPIVEPKEIIAGLVERIDGLFLTGGKGSCVVGDATEVIENPRDLRGYDPVRYDFERKLLEAAMGKGIPIIGTCRGMQMICEVCGGTMGTEFLIPSERETFGVEHRQKEDGKIPTHTVELETGSLLHSILGKTEIKVNSFHHQACKEVGEGFKVSALSAGGVIEAIEKPDYNFLLGLQFHPEKMYRDIPVFKKIFDQFILSCEKG